MTIGKMEKFSMVVLAVAIIIGIVGLVMNSMTLTVVCAVLVGILFAVLTVDEFRRNLRARMGK